MSSASDTRNQTTLLPFASKPCRSIQKYCPENSLVLAASPQGEVLEFCGSGDRDGLAAVASITSRSLHQAVDKLGFGRLTGWVISGEVSYCIAEIHEKDTIVAFSNEVPADSAAIEQFLSHLDDEPPGE